MIDELSDHLSKKGGFVLLTKKTKGKLNHMRNRLLITTALVGLAFASSAAAEETIKYKEYEPGAVISADDLGHNTSDTRISFMGNAALEKDVTMGSYVTLHEKTALTGGKKLTVEGYLTQTAAGSDLSGIDVEIKKASGKDGEVNEGELVIGSDLTVGNLTMTDGTGIWLHEAGDKSLTTDKQITFNGETYVKGTEGVALDIDGDGSLLNNGTLTVHNELTSAVKVVNNGTIDTLAAVAFDNGYVSNGGYLGSEEVDSTISLSGDVALDNGARIVAATADDKGSVTIKDAGTITLNNGSTIDAIDLTIDGGEEGTTITVGGNNASAGRGEGDQAWRNNSYILSYGDGQISNANITLNDGGHLMQGAKGTSENPTPGTMTLTNSTVTLNNGSMMIAYPNEDTNSSFKLAEKTTVNLDGGEVKSLLTAGSDSVVNLNNANSTILELAGEGTLNINTDASTELFGRDSKIATANVAKGTTFTIADESAKFSATDMNVEGTLDVGANEYQGNVELKDGSTLSLRVVNGEDAVKNGNVTGTVSFGDEASSNLKVIFDDGVDLGDDGNELALNDAIKAELAKKEDGQIKLANNFMYDFAVDENGAVTASKVGNEKVASNLASAGVSANATGAAVALASASGLNAQGSALSAAVKGALQDADAAAVAQMAEAAAPTVAPMVRTIETGMLNQAYGAVSGQLSGGVVASAAEGKSAGDNVFDRASAWVRTLFNKTELDDTNKAKGFDAKTKGIAFGVDKEVADNIKAGIAYAYGDTEVDGHNRDTDVDSHTFMLYGEYKPSDWYVNGIASYGMSDYSETKYVAGGIKADYDVKTYGLQAMTGYDYSVNGYDITPEAGLRYTHIKQDAYTDTAGQRVKADDMDVLTAIAGVKAGKNVVLDNGMTIRPEARLAMTYDLVDADNKAVVNVGDNTYQISGDDLDRFGIEAGLGVTAELNDQWDVSLGYEGRFRDDFKDNSGILSAKYKF